MASPEEMRAPRELRLEIFRARRNRAFAQSRMRAAMIRMARVKLAPTNLEIARVVGVPKGTVDSGLYWLKRKLASVYDPDIPRQA
jgi:hypothetical protein